MGPFPHYASLANAVYRGRLVRARKRSYKELSTHYSCQITLQFFDDPRETPAGLVEELPAPAHSRAVPSRGGVFRNLRDVAFWFVPDLVLEEGAELDGVGKEEGKHRRRAHYDGTVESVIKIQMRGRRAWAGQIRVEGGTLARLELEATRRRLAFHFLPNFAVVPLATCT